MRPHSKIRILIITFCINVIHRAQAPSIIEFKRLNHSNKGNIDMLSAKENTSYRNNSLSKDCATNNLSDCVDQIFLSQLHRTHTSDNIH